MRPKISLIVPVYNVESYLERCIDSLINQTIKEIEILLIDDGSTDNSGHICDDYAKIDKRIRVIHKKNGGLSDARNRGLEIASGDYIGFVDSDDYVHRDMFQVMYETMFQENCDIVEVGYKEFYEKDTVQVDITKKSLNVYDKNSAVIRTILDIKCRNYVWNKLYKKQLWKDIEFPVGKVYEDIFTTHKVISKSNKLVKLDANFYYYYQREGSIVNSKFNLKHHIDHYDAVKDMILFIEKEYPEMLSIAILKYLIDSFISFYMIKENRGSHKNLDNILRNMKKEIVDFSRYLGRENEFFDKAKQYFSTEECEEILKLRKKLIFQLRLLKLSTTVFYSIKKVSKSIKNVKQ